MTPTPLRRVGRPDDCANLVAFSARRTAAGSTASLIYSNGGKQ